MKPDNLLGPKKDVKEILEKLGIKEGDKPIEEEEGPKIVLPNSADTKGRLEKKLEEYKERIKNKAIEKPYQAPEVIWSTGSGYKLLILEELLREGVVYTWKFSKKLEERFGFVAKEKFDNAAAVIDDYCKTNGTRTYGGTGF